MMNLDSFLDFLLTPGWRKPEARMKKTRTPFRSSRKHEIAPLIYLKSERFESKEARDFRFHELREAKTKDLSKYSTYEGNQSVWYLVHS